MTMHEYTTKSGRLTIYESFNGLYITDNQTDTTVGAGDGAEDGTDSSFADMILSIETDEAGYIEAYFPEPEPEPESVTLTPDQIYAMMEQIARAVDLPQHYLEDLTVHDRNTLQEPDFPRTFGWLLRECGTWIIWPKSDDPKANDRNIGKVRFWTNPRNTSGAVICFHFDGERFRAMSPNDLLKALGYEEKEHA